MEKELTRRRFGPPVRLEVEEDIDDHVLDLLSRELQISGEDIYRLPGPLDLRGLFLVGDLERSDLEVRPVRPAHPAGPLPHREQQAGRHLRRGAAQGRPAPPPVRLVLDVGAGVHRAGGRPTPGSSRSSRPSTARPATRRSSTPSSTRPRPASRSSPSSRSRRGSTRSTTSAGPASSSRPASTSSTASSASRPTPSCASSSARRPRAWSATATSAPATTTRRPPAIYEDLGLLTTDPQVGEDLTRLFNQLSGHRARAAGSSGSSSPRGPCAPASSSRSRTRWSATSETRQRAGSSSSSTRSSTSRLIDALYRASQAGVRVDIWVRGICALRPGVEGLSENIRGPLDPRAASSSTPGSSGSATTASRSRLHRQRRHDAPQPRPPGRGAAARHRAAARRRDHLTARQGDRGVDVALGPGRGRPLDPPPPVDAEASRSPTSRPP